MFVCQVAQDFKSFLYLDHPGNTNIGASSVNDAFPISTMDIAVGITHQNRIVYAKRNDISHL